MKGRGNTGQYAAAGVNVTAADLLSRRIGRHAAATCDDRVLKGVGGFGALYRMPSGYSEPVLVSGADGVGTKLALALEHGGESRIGIDLVAMCVNDILTHGAEPLYFLDYYACGRLDPEAAETVVAGIAEGCLLAGCALVGGETAEMPGMYPDGGMDLAGFAVGICEQSALLPRDDMCAGDVIIGLESSGAHSNGYSLVRKWLAEGVLDPKAEIDGRRLVSALLEPTRIYSRAMLAARDRLKGAAHITGGGFLSNLMRVVPDGLAPRLDPAGWPCSALFEYLRMQGGIGMDEMMKVFNCGIGMALVVAQADEDCVLEALKVAGEKPCRLGVLA